MSEPASEPGGWWPTPQMHTLRAFATRMSEYVYRSDYTTVRERVTWRLAVGVLEQPQCLDHLPLEQWQSVVLMLHHRLAREPEDSHEDWVGRLSCSDAGSPRTRGAIRGTRPELHVFRFALGRSRLFAQ